MKTALTTTFVIALSVLDVGPAGSVMAGGRTDGVASAAPLPPERRGGARGAEDGRADPVVLVVLDGVRWQEIFGGTDAALAAGSPLALEDAAALMPNLHTLRIERGASLGGTPRGHIHASGPNFVSLPSYREIFSGRAVADCTDNECDRIARDTVVDELRDRDRKVAVFSSWEKIELAASARPRDVVVSAGRPPGDDTDPWPGVGPFRRDRATADVALAHLERERPDLLFLGLGETDEYAHRGDYAGYLSALKGADRVLGELLAALDRMGERGARTHVLVTTDHGRSASFRHHGKSFPESSRVWLVASGPRIEARGDLDDRGDRRLRDVAPTIRFLQGLPPEAPAADRGIVIEGLFTKNERARSRERFGGLAELAGMPALAP